MLRFFPLVPFALFVTLLACGKNDPVDEEAEAPADELVGDASATGLAAPANAAAAEAADQAALPPATGGLVWTLREAERIALFGPPGSPAFSIQCQKPREGQAQLVFVRYLPPTNRGEATLSFTGNGQAASLPVAAIADPAGLGGHWRAVSPPDEHARDVGEAFAGPAAVEVSVSGTPPLVVPADPAPRRVLADCLDGRAAG